jgi:hypothetical protein
MADVVYENVRVRSDDLLFWGEHLVFLIRKVP